MLVAAVHFLGSGLHPLYHSRVICETQIDNTVFICAAALPSTFIPKNMFQRLPLRTVLYKIRFKYIINRASIKTTFQCRIFTKRLQGVSAPFERDYVNDVCALS